MKSFFYLQRNDRRALTAVLAVIAVVAGIMTYIGDGGSMPPAIAADSTAINVAGGDARGGGTQDGGYYATEGRKAELFAFDPNTADSTQLLRLGLAPWQVRSIYRYRAKGGIYRDKADFARLYGLTVGQYRRLEPYIRISPDYRPASEVYSKPSHDAYARDTIKYPLKLKPGQTVSLNTADTTLLKRVPGIGSGFAGAIIRLRERLGGFYDTAQLLALPYFTADPSACKKLNVNKLTLNQLRRHPYIGFYFFK